MPRPACGPVPSIAQLSPECHELGNGRPGLALQDVNFTVGTGYGRFNVPFANKAVTEIACHTRGANFMYGLENEL